MGAEIAAAEAEEDDRRPVRRPRATGLALGRPRDLARLRTINGFYASLVGHARRRPEARLLDWMTAAEVARWSDGIVTPDAFGEWAEGDRSVEFFLVVDRGGPVEALVADLSRYERFDVERGTSAVVFIACRSQPRETVLRGAVKGHRTLATTGDLLAGSRGPDQSIWQVDGDGESRHSFRSVCAAYELPPGEPSPRAWLYSRGPVVTTTRSG